MRSPPTKMMPSPRATIPLVPLIGQSRNPTPRAAHSRASRSVSAGEMVLICTTVRPRAVALRHDVVTDDVAARRAQTTGHRGAEQPEPDHPDGRHAAQQALHGG